MRENKTPVPAYGVMICTEHRNMLQYRHF